MKPENVVFKPSASNDTTDEAEAQVFFEIPPNQNSNNNQAVISYYQKYKKQRRIIRILLFVAAILAVLLIITVAVIIYWALEYNKQGLPQLNGTTTVSPVTSSEFVTTDVTNQTTQYISSISLTTATTIMTTTTALVEPVIFIPGKFNFTQAANACKNIDRKLALKDDMQAAFEAGYERCKYGWMGDLHAGYVMQKKGARKACGGGKVGLIYSSLKKSNQIVGGANCAPVGEQLPFNYFQEPLKNNRSVNWWVTMDPADVYDLKHLLEFDWRQESQDNRYNESVTLMRALRMVFPCCTFLNLTVSPLSHSAVVKQRIPSEEMRYLATSYKKEFSNPDLKVFFHFETFYEPMFVHGAATTYRSRTIDEIVAKTIEAGVDGIVVEYEPTHNYTREHAELYRSFLDDLCDKLQKHQLQLAMLVSNWGILKYYDIYSKSKVGIIGSMSSTYYGHNITNNKKRVKEMLQSINENRLQIGIGTTHIQEESAEEDSFDWNKTQLDMFLNWLKNENVHNLLMYPRKWRQLRRVEKFYLESLLNFAAN